MEHSRATSKPTIFIASAAESYEAVVQPLKAMLSEVADIWDWRNPRVLSDGIWFLDSLVNMTRLTDYAIIVLGADDTRLMRDEQGLIPRDNVVFELGLFRATLASNEIHGLVEQSALSGLPQDLSGSSYTLYNRLPNGIELTAQSTESVRSIARKILGHWQRNPISYRFLPSTAFAQGYWDNCASLILKEMTNARQMTLLLDNDQAPLVVDAWRVHLCIIMPETLAQVQNVGDFISAAIGSSPRDQLRRVSLQLSHRQQRDASLWISQSQIDALKTGISTRSVVIFDIPTTLGPLAKVIRTVIRGSLMSLDESDHQEVAYLREVNVFGNFLLSRIEQLQHRYKPATFWRASPATWGLALAQAKRSADGIVASRM